MARSPRSGSYGKRNTAIITWFGAGKPECLLDSVFKDVIDDVG